MYTAFIYSFVSVFPLQLMNLLWRASVGSHLVSRAKGLKPKVAS